MEEGVLADISGIPMPNLFQAPEELAHVINVLNAGGYTHTSVALADCIAAIATPVVEVHISQPAAREEFRHNSLIAGKCIASISGFGLDSYRLAVEGIISKES